MTATWHGVQPDGDDVQSPYSRDRRTKHDPSQYLAWAESSRRLAAGILDGEFRTRLLTMAEEYERQAWETTRTMIVHLEQRGFAVLGGESARMPADKSLAAAGLGREGRQRQS